MVEQPHALVAVEGRIRHIRSCEDSASQKSPDARFHLRFSLNDSTDDVTAGTSVESVISLNVKNGEVEVESVECDAPNFERLFVEPQITLGYEYVILRGLVNPLNVTTRTHHEIESAIPDSVGD
jgi:hypothetical protein